MPANKSFPRSRRLGSLTFAFAAFGLLACLPRHATELRAVEVPVTELTVAAAADLKFALADLLVGFRQIHPGITVKVAYGSSGNFHAQIRNGAPYDLYFSADIAYPRQLAEAGLALDGDVFRYAIGRLVVWVPADSPIDVVRLHEGALLAPSARKVAIANPRHAPYGAAAVAALKKLGVLDRVSPRFVLGDNIAQTAQFVQTGAADIGVISLSLAVSAPLRESGRYWEIPADAFPRMDQGGLILRSTRSPDEARALRDYILGPAGRELLRRYGFFLPDS